MPPRIVQPMLKFSALLVAALLISASIGAAQTQRDSTHRQVDLVKARAKTRGYPPGVQDNSFLIEEAYNQDDGVVQHISGFQHDARTAAYTYQFTQEWPVGGVANQLSYSLSLVRPDDGPHAGPGDARLNYRYQLVGDGEAILAVAPRLTAILPTGNYRRGRGFGSPGVEAWLPASLVVSDQIVVHANLGTTIVPHARNVQGDRATTAGWTGGGSAIWLVRPFFNVLVEALYQSTSDVIGPGLSDRGSMTTISPGIRWAYNFESGLQIVPGLALPIGVGPSRAPTALLVYLSFEHPFTAAARERAAKQR